MTDIWTPDPQAPVSDGGDFGDLAYTDYADLLDALRKDLQLNATTDLLFPSVLQAIYPKAPSAMQFLIDLAGKSPFLQLLSTQQLQIGFGNGSLSWPGGQAFSNVVAMPHGIGRTPQAVDACARLFAGDAPVDIHYAGNDATNISWRAHTTDGSLPANTYTTPFFWIAIG